MSSTVKSTRLSKIQHLIVQLLEQQDAKFSIIWDDGTYAQRIDEVKPEHVDAPLVTNEELSALFVDTRTKMRDTPNITKRKRDKGLKRSKNEHQYGFYARRFEQVGLDRLVESEIREYAIDEDLDPAKTKGALAGWFRSVYGKGYYCIRTSKANVHLLFVKRLG
jgi:hypothetical protein